jgi:chemotaxis protein MotD
VQPVASEATSHASKPSLPNPARAAPSSERTQDSPFASLLDDGTPASGEQPAQSPPVSGDKPARTAQPDSAQAAAQGAIAALTGGNVAQPDDDTISFASIAAVLVAAVGADQPASADKVSVDVKTIELAVADADAKPGGDGEPTDSLTPADPAAIAASDPSLTNILPTVAPALGTIAPAAPAAIVQAACDGVAPAAPAQATPSGVLQTLQAVSAVIPQAAPAAKPPATAANAAPKAKPADLASPQADSSEPADELNPPAKTSFALPGDGKPQPAAGEAGKPAASTAHDEVAANPQHTAAAETPLAPATDGPAAMPKVAADAVQQVSLPPPRDVAPAPVYAAAPAPPAAPAAAVPLAGIAIEIAGKALAGKNRFEIRLDPPELGRIEVRLDVDRNGHVATSLIADRSDTLDLLRRDSSGLERALQDAGLKTSDNGLQFSLRDQTLGRDQGSAPTPGAAQLVVSDDDLAAIDANPRAYGRRAGLGGGIDIRV